jgi:hypothetical protein|tara:strand:+ start:643 stop:828 length:186 start_codon:yes stop_codon:yes gene_type:complete
MLTDTHVFDIQNIIDSSKTNEKLQEKLKKYFLVHTNTIKGVEPTYLAWTIYQNIIQNKRIQ